MGLTPQLADNWFGALLREYRLRTARPVYGPLSVHELARAVSIDPSHLSRLEHGERWPQRALVGALATALRLDPPEATRLWVAAGYCPPRLRTLLLEGIG